MTGKHAPADDKLLIGGLDIDFALKAARVGVWELDPVTALVNWDDRCRELFGLTAHNKLSYEEVIRYVHPDDIERVDRAVSWAMNVESGGRYDVSYRTIGANDGLLRWVRFIGQSYFDETGAVYRFAGVAQEVTQTVETQQRVEEDLTRFKYMADNASDPFILMQEDGAFAYLNQLALDRWGYTADEAKQLRVPDVDPTYNKTVFGAAFGRAQIEKIPPFETMHRRKDGTVYPVEINMGGLMLGDRPYLFAVARDIAERKKVEQALRDSETLFRNVTNRAPTGLWLSDPAGGLTYLNKTLVDWTGLPYESLLGSGWASAIIDEDRQRSAETFLTAVAARAHYDVMFRIKKKDGRIMWCEAAGDPFYHDDGSYGGYAGFCMDVDELVKGREAVQQSETKLRSLIANAPASIGLYVGHDLIIDMPNQMFIDIMGKGPDIAGRPLRDVMPELDSQPFLQILDTVFTSGQMYQSYGSEVAIVRQGVLTHDYYNITYTPLFDVAGAVYAVLEIAIDVTGEVIAKKKLEASQQQVLASFEQSPVGIAIIIGQDLSFRMVNPFYGQLVGRIPSELVGKPLLDALPELKGQGFDLLLRKVMATNSPYVANEVAIPVVRDNQLETIYVDLSYQPWREASQDTDEGPVSGVLVVAIDVSQQVVTRQAVEQQVQERTEQLATINDELTQSNQLLIRSNENLEKFAYIASHDLQEPLRKIQAFGDLLKIRYADRLGDGSDYLERMQAAASRMSNLIRDLLTFSRISTHQDTIEPVPLQAVIDTVLTDLDMRIRDTNAVIDVHSLPVVQGDALQLGQLFQNLLTNALKFRRTDADGILIAPRISVNCRTIPVPELPILARPTRIVTAYYQIDVTDNGIGFDEKYTDRIFQVFQRLHNKSEFAGTGIGLAICAKVVANHGGAITATSQPGKGATFSIFLPC